MTPRAIAFDDLGVTVTPIAETTADDAVLILFRYDDERVPFEHLQNLERYWHAKVRGTRLEGVATLCLPTSIDVDVVRKRS